jgi:hypothetical protein
MVKLVWTPSLDTYGLVEIKHRRHYGGIKNLKHERISREMVNNINILSHSMDSLNIFCIRGHWTQKYI